MSPFSPVRAPRWLVVLGVVAIPALPVAAWVVGGQVSDNTKISEQIQQSRTDATLSSCREQNERHDRTIHTLDLLLAQAIRRSPERAVQIRQSRASTVLLINSLAPKRDCEQRVHDLVTIHP